MSESPRKSSAASLPPIRALIVDGRDLAGGDKNLLVHAAQELGAAEIRNFPNFRYAPFTEAAEYLVRESASKPPCVTLFLTLGHPNGDAEKRRWLKNALAPALFLNFNNDTGIEDSNRRADGIDLQISPVSSKNACVSGAGMCYLDALPAAQPRFSRAEAERYFRENHDLVLKGPVTVVAIGYPNTDIRAILETVPAEGTLLVTTGPRTASLRFTTSKSPRLIASGQSPHEDKIPNTLYEKEFAEIAGFHALRRRSDMFYYFRRNDENNPYAYIVAAADRAIVTDDSMSMPSDFVAAGVPIALTNDFHAHAAPAHFRRVEAFAKHLIKQGYACKLKGKDTVWPTPPRKPRPAEVMRKRVFELIRQVKI